MTIKMIKAEQTRLTSGLEIVAELAIRTRKQGKKQTWNLNMKPMLRVHGGEMWVDKE